MTTAKYVSTDFPIERVWELYDYNPLTGYLISKSRRKAGQPVIGTLSNRNMWKITLTREDWSTLATNYARAVFAWCNARWPEGSIDHKNRDIRDNRIWNLREADVVLQSQNKGNFNYGAIWHKVQKKWHAQIQNNGNHKYLGTFDTQKEAQEAYMAACREIGRNYLEPVLLEGRYVPAERQQ
jgi:hypothetical protein